MESCQAANVFLLRFFLWIEKRKFRDYYPGENRYAVLYQRL